MKTLYLLLLLFVLAGGASAQGVSDSSAARDVAVIKQSWRMMVRNPALDEDPMRINQDQTDIQRAQRATQRENANRAARGQDPLPMPRGVPSRRNMARATAWTVFIYEAKFSNTGSRKIRKLVWEYVFFLPGTQEEVGRRQFISKVGIAPGKTGSVSVRSVAPPADTVDISQAGKKPRDQYAEQVVIRSIEYADGSVWERPTN